MARWREAVIDVRDAPDSRLWPRDRLTTIGVSLGLMFWSFLQHPGAATFDTKFDLTQDPGPFMLRSLHLWNQQSNFGELQNQAYGYLFPQGSFHLLGEWAGLPDWVVQRLWSGLLLVVAYDGARRLMRALSGDGARPWPSQVAGLAYATAPRLLGLSGVLSAEVLPTAVVVWVVLPIVLAQRGRLSPRTGGLLSGVAVLFMGGVNAVENLAALPLPFFVVLSTIATVRGRRLAGWWALGTSAAAVWWMAPLLVLGKYSPPFLDYIETSSAVVNPLGWANSVRGADHWLAYIYVGGRPWWPGAYQLAYSPHLVLATAAVAALGIAGLGLRTMPLRRALIASLLLGLVCLTVARQGTLAAPTQGLVQYLLDGPLSMLRNVHKVDPLVRVPLALGLGHLLERVLRRLEPEGESAGLAPVRAAWLRPVALASTLLLILIAAQPLVTGSLRRPGWREVPQAWSEATAYLGRHADGATLVLPGSGFGQQTWGWTIDEPIQGLATSPWATRSQVPLTPGATIRFLDSIEERFEDGLGSPRLASMLRRAGISHVLIRRDIDLTASDVPLPSRIDLAVSRSPGLTPVASFGDLGGVAILDLYSVDGASEQPVDAVTTDSFATMAGGPEDVFTAEESGALDPGRPVLFSTAAPELVGDGYRRRDRGFGRLHDSVSQVMAPDEPYRVRRSAHDYPGVPGQHRVVARYTGIEQVVASSSGGYTDTLGPVRPELGPYSALDGIESTYWQSAPLTVPTDQWLQFRLSSPTLINQVTVLAGVDGISGVPVRSLTIRVGDVERQVPVDPNSGRATARFAEVRAEVVRIQIDKVAGADGSVAIREVAIPGVRIERSLVVPDVGATGSTSMIFRARPHRRACISTPFGEQCEVNQGRVSEEERGIERTFSLAAPARYRIGGQVVALGSEATQRLLEPLGAGKVRVRASSTYHEEPGVSAQLAFDGDSTTYWMSDPSDKVPTLHLEWGIKRRISSLRVVAAGANVSTPPAAVIRAGKRVRTVEMGTQGIGQFTPLRAKHLDILFPPAKEPDGSPMPVGVAELLIPELKDLVAPLRPETTTGAICGIGPEVTIDGRVHRTRVVGTIDDLLGGTPLELVACGHPVKLDPGTHELRVRSTEQFAATALTLEPAESGSAATGRPLVRRPVSVVRWTSNDRTVRIAAGDEAILRVPENVNLGWQATLAGNRLRPVTVDGWQQGYLVPAGAGGTVHLVFAPDRPYRQALLGGLIAAVLLSIGAAWSYRRERGYAADSLLHDSPDAQRAWPWPVRPVAWLAGFTVAGPAVAVGLIVGDLALGGLPIGNRVVTNRATRHRWVVFVSAGLVLASGIVSAIALWSGPRQPPVFADCLAALGVGMLAAGLLTRRAEEAG